MPKIRFRFIKEIPSDNVNDFGSQLYREAIARVESLFPIRANPDFFDINTQFSAIYFIDNCLDIALHKFLLCQERLMAIRNSLLTTYDNIEYLAITFNSKFSQSDVKELRQLSFGLALEALELHLLERFSSCFNSNVKLRVYSLTAFVTWHRARNFCARKIAEEAASFLHIEIDKSSGYRDVLVTAYIKELFEEYLVGFSGYKKKTSKSFGRYLGIRNMLKYKIHYRREIMYALNLSSNPKQTPQYLNI